MPVLPARVQKYYDLEKGLAETISTTYQGCAKLRVVYTDENGKKTAETVNNMDGKGLLRKETHTVYKADGIGIRSVSVTNYFYDCD